MYKIEQFQPSALVVQFIGSVARMVPPPVDNNLDCHMYAGHCHYQPPLSSLQLKPIHIFGAKRDDVVMSRRDLRDYVLYITLFRLLAPGPPRRADIHVS